MSREKYENSMKTLITLTLLISSYNVFLIQIVEANPFEEKIHLRLYKNGTDFEQTSISQGETLFQESKGYNQSLPLVLLIHGIATGADCYFVNGLIEAFTKRQLTNDYNIFAVDMPEIFENSVRNEFYIGILASVQPAGEVIGGFLSKVVNLKLTTPEDINIIGYSMGAQVAGYAARTVKNRFGHINFIAGLDPAGPGFHTRWGGRPALIHVSAADANTTHFYHTNSISCGTRDRVATADFVFNKGTVQPGCTKNAGLDCSHVRVPNLYIEAVTKPTTFVARKCSSWDEFKTCDCNNHKTVSITFPPDSSAKGIFYLRTRAKSPFALGRRGSRCSKIIHMQHENINVDNINPGDNSIQSKMSHEIKIIKESLHPKNKFKDKINLHLINGIRKLEELHNPGAGKQQVVGDGEVANETNGVTNKLDEKKLENTSLVNTEDVQVKLIN